MHEACPQGQVDAINVDTGGRRTLTAFRGGERQSSVFWQDHCSPDGRRLMFLHNQRSKRKRDCRVCSATTDGSEVREVCSMESVWNFACSWEHDVLLVSVAGPQPSLWQMALNGGGATHMRYVMRTKAMRTIPEAAIPRLPATLPGVANALVEAPGTSQLVTFQLP